MLRVFHVRKKKLRLKDGVYFISKSISNQKYFQLDANQVIKTEEYTRPGKVNNYVKETWVKVSVTDWIWNRAELLKELEIMRMDEEAIIEGETHFGINWDYVIGKRMDRKRCFYCMFRLNNKNKTKDHLVPKAILGAYGYKVLPNNTVPCCYRCNNMKANLHPEVFMKKISMLLHQTGTEYYRIVLNVLKQVVISSEL